MTGNDIRPAPFIKVAPCFANDVSERLAQTPKQKVNLSLTDIR